MPAQKSRKPKDEALPLSLLRLLDFAKKVTARSSAPVTDLLSLRKQMGIESATVTNWKKRGKVSSEAAMDAEKRYGCSPRWVLDGLGPERALHGSPPASIPDKFADPSDTESGVMKDLDALHPEDKKAWIEGLRVQADKAREIGRRELARFTGKKDVT